MKPAPFAYARAGSVEEVFDCFATHGDEMRLLAGGQSLLATLALRLSEPAMLLDINGITALRFIERRGEVIAIGALTRYCDLEASQLIARHVPLVAQAMPHIAHAAIRNRGTIGGSLALADPAAELPACMVALAAVLVVAGAGGERRIAADDFFLGIYATALAPGEMIVRIEIPVAPPDGSGRARLAEFSRRHGDYAMVGLAAQAQLQREGGGFASLRLVFFGCGERPVRAHGAEALVLGGAGLPAPTQARLREAMQADLDPQSDLHAGADTRRHLAAVLAARALSALRV
ncbi:MAG: FAD binding domain-containing protein [Proteobacteria bacterium]|nr:FAD binding domain-containing protein [Pseudomonadota bacterium]